MTACGGDFKDNPRGLKSDVPLLVSVGSPKALVTVFAETRLNTKCCTAVVLAVY